MGDLFADLGYRKKKKKEEQAAPSPPSGLFGQPAPQTRVPTGPQRGVEGYVPTPARAATLPQAQLDILRKQGYGPRDTTLVNLIYAHNEVFGTYPDFSLTSDLIDSGEVDFNTPEEAVQFFMQVKKSYTGRNDWMLDPSVDPFGEGSMKRASGVEGFSAETDILDPEMLASFRPKSVNDFLFGPYMKHTVEGEQSMFRPNRMRLDELTILLPKQWAISELGDALTSRGRRRNPDLEEDEALMAQLNGYIAERLPKTYVDFEGQTRKAPQANARWQGETEAGLRQLQFLRAASLYMATSIDDGETDEAAAGYLATAGFRNMMTTLEEQIRIKSDPTGKADEQRRAMITDWYVMSRDPAQTPQQALHELYDINKNAVTNEGREAVGSDHVNALWGIVEAVGHGISTVANDWLELDTIYESQAMKDAAHAAAPFVSAMGDVLGVVAAPLKIPMAILDEYGADAYGLFSALQTADGVVPQAVRAFVFGPSMVWGDPRKYFAEFVHTMQGESPDGDISFFGNFLEEFKADRAAWHAGDTNILGHNAMTSWGLDPIAHPEVEFLWSFGLQTGVDMGIWSGAKGLQALAAPTSTYRRLTKLGKTTFVNKTIGGMATKWINEDPNRAISRMQRIFGIETEQARQVVAKVVGQDPAEAHFHRRPVAIGAVRDALDESVRVKGVRLDPYAWGFRKAVQDEIEFSNGKWYSPDKRPSLQKWVAHSNVREAIPLTGDRQEMAGDWIDHIHRHVLNLADRYKTDAQTGATEVEVIKAKVKNILMYQYHGIEKKHRGSYGYTKMMLKELDEVESMTDLSLWRQSLYARAEQLSVSRLRAIDPKAAAGLSKEALDRLTMQYRGQLLDAIDNDVADMLKSHSAEKTWRKLVGDRSKNLAERNKWATVDETGKLHVPLGYQHSHWNVSQIRKALRKEARKEPKGAYVPEQGGKLDPLTGKPAELSKAYNPATADQILSAQQGEIDYFSDLVHKLGLIEPQHLADHTRARTEMLPGHEKGLVALKEEMVEELRIRTERALDLVNNSAIERGAAEAARDAMQARINALERLIAEVGENEESLGQAVDDAIREVQGAAAAAAASGQDAEQAALAAQDFLEYLVRQQQRWVVRQTRAELELDGDLPALQNTIDQLDAHLDGMASAIEQRGVLGLTREDNETGAQFLERLLRELQNSDQLSETDAAILNELQSGDYGRALAMRREQALRIAERRQEIDDTLFLQQLANLGYTDQASRLEGLMRTHYEPAHGGTADVRIGEGEFEHLLPEHELIERLNRQVASGEITDVEARRRLRNAWTNRLARQDADAAQMRRELNLLAERLMNGEARTIGLPAELSFDAGLRDEGSLLSLINQQVQRIVETQGFRRETIDVELPTELAGREAAEETVEETVEEVVDEGPDFTMPSEAELYARGEWEREHPELPWTPWTDRLTAAEEEMEAANDALDEVMDGVTGRDQARWRDYPEETPAEVVEARDRQLRAVEELFNARLEWERGNPAMINVRLQENLERKAWLERQIEVTEDPLERLEMENELQFVDRAIEAAIGPRQEIDDILAEIDLPEGATLDDLPLLEALRSDAAGQYAMLRSRAEAAALSAADDLRYAQGVAHRFHIHQQRLQNYRARAGMGTVYRGVAEDPEMAKALRDGTAALDPAATIPTRVEYVYKMIKDLRGSVERLTTLSPENWFDYEWADAEGKNFLLQLEPQPGMEWQLKQFHYPRYNYNKLSKFMYGGVTRATEYLNSKKWFGYVSADDFTSFYKALVMAKISTLLRIPMADEMTRFIPEHVNPLEALRDARWMRDYDKMPDDVKADIASLMQRMSYGDSEFIDWSDRRYREFMLKMVMDDRRDATFAYWMSGRMKGAEGMRQAVRDWLTDPKNENSSMRKYVEEALAGSELGEVQIVTRGGALEQVEDGVLLAYSLIGMTPGRGLHNLAYQTHRIARDGTVTSQVLNMARMLETKYDGFTKHPAFGHFYRMADEDLVDRPEVMRMMEQGKWHSDVKLGRDAEVEINGEKIALSSRLTRKSMQHALHVTEKIVKTYGDNLDDTRHLMPWIVGRDAGIEVGGIPVVRELQRFTYTLLDRFGSKMNEMMYATAFKREKEALMETAAHLGEDRIEELAHFAARRYVYDTMFNGSVYFGEDMLRNVFMFLPAYRQFVEYWVPQMVKKPLTVGNFVYRANTQKTSEGKEGFGWTRPILFPNLQVNLSSASFLINQGNNGVWGWLPGGGPIITMPVSLLASLNKDDTSSLWGELPQHWPFTFAGPFRALNSPMDKVVFALTGRRLPWPFGSDPDRDPWRELMATRQDALDGKWPDEPKNYSVTMRLHALVEGGWNYIVPYQMRYSDVDVERMVMSRKAYSQAKTPEAVLKILDQPGNETFKQFVEWQNLPSYLQFEYLQQHPKIIPFMVSGFSAGENSGAGRAITWSKLRTFSGVADPTAYHERLGYRFGQLKAIGDAVEARAIRDEEVKWWEQYRKKHIDDHNIYRLTEEWERSEGAFGVGGHFYQQGRRGYAYYQDEINLKWAGIDDSFIGISSYDADSFRLAQLMDAMGGASKKLLQMSPNYEMYVLRKVQKSRDSVREIAKRFLDVRVPTRLTPSDIIAAGYNTEEAVKLAEAVNYIDELWDKTDAAIKPLGKYGYTTSKGRALRKQAIMAQNRLIHSNPLLEQFLGEGAVSLFRSTYLTKPVWERTDFVDLENMDPVERETFYRLLTRKVDGKRVLTPKQVPFLPEDAKRVLPQAKIIGYQPVVKNGKVVSWKAQVRLGAVTGTINMRKQPKGTSSFSPTVEEAIRLMQFSFEHTPTTSAADLLGWRAQVRATMPRWAQDLAYDWVRAEAWKHYFAAASSARSHMRDTVNPWYSDTPGFSSQSKYGMKLKKWLQSYAKYLTQLSPEFGTEYRSYNDDNMLTNAILGWYL